MNTSSAYRDYQFGLSSAMASELRRMEESRLEWFRHIKPMDTFMDSLHSINSTVNSALMSSLSMQSMAEQLSSQSVAAQWRQMEQEQLKRMLDPITSIQKHFAVDGSLKNLMEQATRSADLSRQIADSYTRVLKLARLATALVRS